WSRPRTRRWRARWLCHEEALPVTTARHTLRVRVPASTANLGSGFDALGLALQMYLEVEATPGGLDLKIEAEGLNTAQIPLDRTNLIYRQIRDQAGPAMPQGLTLRI